MALVGRVIDRSAAFLTSSFSLTANSGMGEDHMQETGLLRPPDDAAQ